MAKDIILVGDRVLVSADNEQERTHTGLYLPAGVKEKEKIQTGTIVKVGPGYPVPNPAELEDEPWKSPEVAGNYFPLQAKEGDYCMFLRNAAIEIEFEQKKYLVVPHSAILLIIREN